MMKQKGCKVLNWFTTLGILVVLVYFLWAGTEQLKNPGYLILISAVLIVLNLVTWQGVYKVEIAGKKGRNRRFIDLILFYVMLIVMIGARIFLHEFMEENWKIVFSVVTLAVVSVTGLYRRKEENDEVDE